MISELKILELSEPMERIYSEAVDALLVNMAKHFKEGKGLTLEEWEMRKLSEVGQLNRESAAIIAKITGQAPEEVWEALKNAALSQEPELAGVIDSESAESKDSETVAVSANVLEVLRAYDRTLKEKAELINHTMMQSVVNQYRKIISNTIAAEQAQDAIDIAAGKVAIGTESRQEALRKALAQIHKEGINGFVDRAGRRWTPDAYVSMNMNTTIHNTMIDVNRTAAVARGNHIFRVSRHSGARPLCYPYQGKYYSWDNRSGTFTDGEGKRHRYEPISSTSYGKPAGLFGINCGHSPIEVEVGVSIPRDRTAQDAEENEKSYRLSQEQRKLERDIRYAKQKAEMMKAAGDTDGYKKELGYIKDKEAAYTAFCKRTGRAKRMDRTKIYSEAQNERV